MPRYKITIEYDGTSLAGWQAQKEQYSVQEAIETAIFKSSGERVQVVGSGRTDAGVHALGQVAHFDLAKDWDEFRIKEAVNFHLRDDEKLPVPRQVAILAAEKASDDFHARFSATSRHYVYRIINRREHLALDQNRAWGVPEKLDLDAMQKAAKLLFGLHDFSSFRSSECQSKSPVKTLDEIRYEASGEYILVHVNARSFLHHMVRNLVGTLRLIGNGKWTEADLLKALEAKDRRAGGETAPAQGLYLTRVEY